jgi:hypothetical protein
MDLTSMWNSVADQGAMFWSATGAVALGTTLILSAGIMHLRRWRHRPSGKISSVSATNPVAKPVAESKGEHAREPVPAMAAPGPSETLSRRAMNADIPQSASRSAFASEKENSRDLLLLLARLRSSADRLEDYRRAQGENTAPAGESPLKESLNGVDYLFRSGAA